MNIDEVKALREVYDNSQRFLYDTWGVDDPSHYWQTQLGAERRRLIPPSDHVENVIFSAFMEASDSLHRAVREAETLVMKTDAAAREIHLNVVKLTALRNEIESRSKVS